MSAKKESTFSKFKFNHSLTLLTINSPITAKEIKDFLKTEVLDLNKTNIPEKTKFISFSGCHGTPKGEMVVDPKSEQFFKDLENVLYELYQTSKKNFKFPGPIFVGRKEGGKMTTVTPLQAALKNETPDEDLAKLVEDLIKVHSTRDPVELTN